MENPNLIRTNFIGLMRTRAMDFVHSYDLYSATKHYYYPDQTPAVELVKELMVRKQFESVEYTIRELKKFLSIFELNEAEGWRNYKG